MKEKTQELLDIIKEAEQGITLLAKSKHAGKIIDAIATIYGIAGKNKKLMANIAKLHKALFDEYLKAGFDKEQALKLVTSLKLQLQ